jgi:hypothetical protein
MCRRHPHHCRTSSPCATARAMREERRFCTGCARTSTYQGQGRWCESGCAPVSPANETRLSSCTRWGCCNHSKCRRQCGRTSPSTSLKAFLTWAASRASSPSSIASPNAHTFYPLATHTPPIRSRYSSLTTSSCTTSPAQS